MSGPRPRLRLPSRFRSWPSLRIQVGAAVVLLCGALCVAAEPAGLGDRVVAFCKEHKGKRVGNGECTTLAAAALQAAGARTHGPAHPRDGGDEPSDDFVWGERFFVLERAGGSFKTTGQTGDVRPGDIIQFRNVKMAGAKSEFESYTLSARQHTAIVAALEENGSALKIYHQNSGGHRIVTATWIRLPDLQQGRFSIFHPVPRTGRQRGD